MAVDEQLVWQTTGLSAFTSIRASLAKRLACQALTRIGDAKRAVHENLDRKLIGRKSLQFAQRKFPGEDGASDAQFSGQLKAFGRRDRHLGGSVQLQLRSDLA